MRIGTASFLLFLFSLSPSFAFADQPPSDASLHELLDVMQAHKIVDAIIAQSDTIGRNAVQQALNGRALDAQEQKILDTQLDKVHGVIERELSWDKISPMYMNIYRTSFDQKEVNDMIAFYKSPTGQAVIEKLPAVMQQSMTQMRTYIATIMPQIQQINQDAISQLQTYEANKKEPAASK
jgi:uncharacterized protein